MQTFTANEAKVHFGEFIDKAQKEPVRVTRRGRTVGIMVSESDYEAMREYYANRLLHTMDRVGARAQQQGLTEEKLDALLSDES
jgi:prevent-host-death family protein